MDSVGYGQRPAILHDAHAVKRRPSKFSFKTVYLFSQKGRIRVGEPVRTGLMTLLG